MTSLAVLQQLGCSQVSHGKILGLQGMRHHGDMMIVFLAQSRGQLSSLQAAGCIHGQVFWWGVAAPALPSSCSKQCSVAMGHTACCVTGQAVLAQLPSNWWNCILAEQELGELLDMALQAGSWGSCSQPCRATSLPAAHAAECSHSCTP